LAVRTQVDRVVADFISFTSFLSLILRQIFHTTYPTFCCARVVTVEFVSITMFSCDPYVSALHSGHTRTVYVCMYVCMHMNRIPQMVQKLRSHYKILRARNITQSAFHSADRQTLFATVHGQPGSPDSCTHA